MPLRPPQMPLRQRQKHKQKRMPRRLPLRAHEMPQPRMRLIGKAQRPTAAEVAANPRARSAVLRVAEKC